MTRGRRAPSDALPSHPSAGVVIGGVLAGLDHAIANRPPVVAQIEEPIRRGHTLRGGFSVEGLDEPIERAEPPDRSGARL